MNNAINMPVFEMIYIIVNFGLGSKVLHEAKEHGVKGGTVLLGKGTANNSILNFLSLYDERKEIVLICIDKKASEYVIEMLNMKFKFNKPNHGIVFTTSVVDVVGSRLYKHEDIEEKRGENKIMYQNIIAIVNKGKAEDVIDAATKAGSKGGTIINGRGSGIHETERVFLMDIEPEKEIVMILAEEKSSQSIIDSIYNALQLNNPGNGIIFVQDVNRVYGLHE